MIVYFVSELILYLSFALLTGTLILALVPSEKKPTIFVRKRWLQLALLSIVITSAMPIVQVVVYLYDGIGLSLTIFNVLHNFEVGKAWGLILGLSIFFYLIISILPVQQNRIYSIISLLLLLAMILAVSLASHAASLTEWTGLVYHMIHFLSTSIWVGVLWVISWFSRDIKNWASFLTWFTPVAIICFSMTFFSGLFMMSLVVDLQDYTTSWLLNYGQALVIKHLLIIPLLVFAFFNGYLMKRRLKSNPSFNPKPWAKIESLLLLFIFTATAVLGQNSPPHDIESTIRTSGVSPLFESFYGGGVLSLSDFQMSLNVLSLIFVFLAIVFFIMLIISLQRKVPPIFSLITSLLCIFSAYAGLMVSFK
ncbi:copper resistance D family protein [Alkalihalobacillus sp. 1P02AB]|uniref:copper resistance D family protein n=1 Tax=Alkalihalobacillus sp. 1P02AB TaxID=3132260 RepID=UPI0039A42E17